MSRLLSAIIAANRVWTPLSWSLQAWRHPQRLEHCVELRHTLGGHQSCTDPRRETFQNSVSSWPLRRSVIHLQLATMSPNFDMALNASGKAKRQREPISFMFVSSTLHLCFLLCKDLGTLPWAMRSTYPHRIAGKLGSETSVRSKGARVGEVKSGRGGTRNIAWVHLHNSHPVCWWTLSCSHGDTIQCEQ